MAPVNPNQTSMPTPGAPGQIDVSLTLLGGESKQLLEAFSNNIASLTESLRDVVKQQESIITSLGQILPSVGGGGQGAYNQASGPSTPPPEPRPAAGGTDNSSRPGDPYGGGTGNRTWKPSEGDRTWRPGEPAPRPRRRGGGDQGNGDTALDGGEEQGPSRIYIPRIGEFNSQDILKQLRHVTGAGAGVTNWMSEKAAANASSAAAMANSGNYTPFASSVMKLSARASGAMAQGTGAASTVLNKMSTGLQGLATVAPYSAAFTQMSGIPLTPGAAVRQGTEMGLAPGGTNLGPFRLPGLNIHTPDFNPLDLRHGIGGSGFLGGGGFSATISPAMKESAREDAQAASFALQPGGSAKWMRGAQESLKQLGWSGGKLQNMAGGWGSLQSSEQYGQGAIGSNTTVAPMIDQMIRFGSSSLSDFVGVLKQLPDAARAANLQIDASNQLLNQFAEASKSQGVNYTQGIETGIGIQTATGMSASTLQGAMASPLVAGRLAATNNVMPGSTMQLGAGKNTQALYSTVQMLWKQFYPQQVQIHGNTQLAKDQAAYIISPLVGGLSTQQIESMVTQSPSKIGAEATVSSNLAALSKNMQWVQSQEPKEGPNAKTTTRDLNTEMMKHQNIYAEAKAVGVKPGTTAWTQIFGTAKNPTSPMETVQKLQDYISNTSKGKTMANGGSPTQVIVGFTPQAQKWLTTQTGQTVKQAANAGQASANSAAATMPDVNQAYTAGSTPSGYAAH